MIPKCPHCDEEVTYLHYYATVDTSGTVEKNAWGKLDYNDIEEITDSAENKEYTCPNCGEALFTSNDSEEDVASFLHGKGDELKSLLENFRARRTVKFFLEFNKEQQKEINKKIDEKIEEFVSSLKEIGISFTTN
jgi:hypothetical protein